MKDVVKPEIELITQYEATMLVVKAYGLAPEYGKGFRLGQAIMNLLPKELYNYVTDNEDFYFWKDNKRSLESFYKQCVGRG